MKVPDHLVAEILDGELIATRRPATPHARAASVINRDLGGPFDEPPGGSRGPGGWWLLFEPELHLGEDVVVPDLAGWRRDRMAALPNAAAIEQAPDWLCEVVSPSTARVDRVQKLRIYARERVAHVWLVDPLARTLELFRLEGERWVVAASHEGDQRIRAEPFDAIELDLARWWLP